MQDTIADRQFISKLRRKLNSVGIRNRTIQRNLHSLAFRAKKSEGGCVEGQVHFSFEGSVKDKVQYVDVEDFSMPNFLGNDLFRIHAVQDVPQQEWDEMFEDAFTALGNSDALDLFDAN